MYKIKCAKCNDVLESVHRHDFKQCKCGACFVDGGNDPYVRIGGNPEDIIEFDKDGNEILMSDRIKKEKENGTSKESND